MDARVEIDEVFTRVTVFDDEMLLSPRFMDQVAARLMPRLRDEELHRERVSEEARICPEGET